MNASEIAKFALKAFEALQGVPQLVQAGASAVALVTNSRDQLQAMVSAGRGPTPAEKAAQDQLIEQLRNELHGP